MITRQDLIGKLSKSICYINVVENIEVKEPDAKITAYWYDSEKECYYPRISRGSGVLINFENAKYIITAAHVLYGDRPFEEADAIKIKNFLVLIEFPAIRRGECVAYKIELGNFADPISIEGILSKFPIDLAFIKVNEKDDIAYNYAIATNLANSPVVLGQEIIGMGFSNEFPIPIGNNYIIRDEDKLKLSRMEVDAPPLVVKKGYISAMYKIELSDFQYTIYHSSILMVAGASGGGIFNEDGECIGIVTEKGFYNDQQEVVITNCTDKSLEGKKVTVTYPIPTATVSCIDTTMIKESLKKLLLQAK